MESIFILCQIVTIHANELSLFEARAMEMSAHWAVMCEMSVKSDRGNRQTVGDWASGPRDLTAADIRRKGVAANFSVLLCVCARLVCLAVDGRCQTSQPHPHHGTTCWTEAIWRAGHLSGLILRRPDPACWPMIHDHTTWQETSHMSSAHPSVCSLLLCLYLYALQSFQCVVYKSQKIC